MPRQQVNLMTELLKITYDNRECNPRKGNPRKCQKRSGTCGIVHENILDVTLVLLCLTLIQKAAMSHKYGA